MRETALAILLSTVALSAQGGQLTIDRMYGGGNLGGQVPTQLKVSPDGERVTFLRPKPDDQKTFDLWEYNVKANATRMLVDSKVLAPNGEQLSDVEKARRERARIAGTHGIVEYSWSPDSSKLLFPLAGKLYLYDLKTTPDKALRTLDTGGGEAIDPQISPKGHFVSYVSAQNLWVIDLADGKPRQLTHDGAGTVHNGEAEFVAQEEMDRFHGYWWAPDDSAVAFERFDEAKVSLVKRFEVYADHSDVIEQRYPAAGATNVEVRLGLIAPGGGAARWIDLGPNPDIYLCRVDWLPDGKRLSYQLMQRDQQHMDLMLVDAASLAQRKLLSETSKTWIELNEDLHFLEHQDAFVWASDRSGFKHVYMYGLDGRLLHPISSGNWNIDSVRAVDEAKGLVYVDSNRDFVPDRQLYALHLDGSNADAPALLTHEDGTHRVDFGRNPAIYVDTFSDPNTPPQVSVHDASGLFLAWIEHNQLDEHHPYWQFKDAHIAPEFGTIKAPNGELLYYRLYKPAHFDPSRRYPVLDTFYGGPHVQTVARSWGDLFPMYMAQHGYVVFTLDNRGMARRGREFSDGIYRQLGNIEVDDQMAGIHWLKTQPFVDPARIGTYGWSYGGFMSAMLLAKHSTDIAAGVVVAPVTDWSLYDTFYTERYLATPQSNAQGYDLSSVLHWVDGLKSPMLLVHGMADDNVQFTNSTKLMAALQGRGTQFQLMTYPGGKHGLSTPEMHKHVFHAIADFLDAHLKGGVSQ
jgi:dipeptidyl-peptidase-4